METRIYFHTITFNDLTNLQSVKPLIYRGIVTFFRKALFVILLLLIVAIISISCNHKPDFKVSKSQQQEVFDIQEKEIGFYNIDNKKLSNEDFENLVCSGQHPRNEYLDITNIYQNHLARNTDSNSKVLFTQSSKQNPIRIYLTHLETDWCKLSGYNLIGNELISVFYHSNFAIADTSEDKALVILTKDEEKYYTTILFSECGARECSYIYLNNYDEVIDFLQNVKTYEEFLSQYKIYLKNINHKSG
jgi:hypothetical protein